MSEPPTDSNSPLGLPDDPARIRRAPLPVQRSPGVDRLQRLPPGQRITAGWPVLHEGPVPSWDPATWDLTLFPSPYVQPILRLDWEAFSRLPRVRIVADMHCVTRWTRLDNLWEGVPTRALRDLIVLQPEVRFVMVHCEFGYTTNLPLDDFFAEDALLATHHDGVPLTPEHGSPVRLVVPRLYAWKSAKWVRGIEFLTDDRPGYWEEPGHGGYHRRGDPWAEERFQDPNGPAWGSEL